MNKEGLFIIWEGPPPHPVHYKGVSPPHLVHYFRGWVETRVVLKHMLLASRVPRRFFFSDFSDFYYLKIRKFQNVRTHRKNSRFFGQK